MTGRRGHLPEWSALTKDERLALIEPHVQAGLSASQIAETVSREVRDPITRNVVIGLINRSGGRLALKVAPRGSGQRSRSGKRRSPSAPVRVKRKADTLGCASTRPSPRRPAAVATVREASADAKPSVAKPNSAGAVCQPPSPAAPVEAPVPVVVPSLASDGDGGTSFESLQEGLCRYPLWPNGTRPTTAEMRFCGEAVHADGASWCSDHLDQVTEGAA
ncbi:GcrA family cell cycle regulator [Amorphus orientalis]|uniref:Uncharacterized protein n=1 Tax=Amorphus orientalis TaxID=649198 RepID=A0AAE3VMU6_9HYPH|nr:GcrA family cell cycle regulator [Amorphus orientalis]MDQ0314823.1 hypothetical protein [Amorphus orientalis]